MERSGVTDLGHAGSDVVPRGRLSSSPGERTVSGGHGGGETPVPIPNTAVKPVSADGTWGVAPWESRTPPGFLSTKPPAYAGGFVVPGLVVASRGEVFLNKPAGDIVRGTSWTERCCAYLVFMSVAHPNTEDDRPGFLDPIDYPFDNPKKSYSWRNVLF